MADKAARNAGALWAHKVLGERFGHFQSSSAHKLEKAETEPLPQTGPAQPPQQHKKHFADLVDALMKKVGTSASCVGRGALEVFGLGQSSSKNVAQEVRRNPRPKPTLASGVNVPTAVAEEDHWRAAKLAQVD